MKYLGFILIAWGAADFGLNIMGEDLWGMTGVVLPDVVWEYSAYIALAVGLGLMQLGKKSDENEAAEQDA